MPEEGALISGDVLPEPGTLPIYESVADTLTSLEKLKALDGVKVLLSAMSRAVSRDEAVASHIESGAGYMREIDELVQRGRSRGGEMMFRPEKRLKFVFERLKLPRAGLIPIVSAQYEGPSRRGADVIRCVFRHLTT